MKAIKTIILVLILSKSYTQIPYNLNSYPEAINTIYLDFDGHYVTNNIWQYYNGSQPFYCPPAGLSTAQIMEVFNRAAEDFSPFDINITTDSTKYWSAPTRRRGRVVITPYYEWIGYLAGYALVDIWYQSVFFGEPESFVFTVPLLNDARYIGEAVSHEIGHTLGLYHQSLWGNVNTDSCRFVTEYRSGRGATMSDISWAPIMGAAYFRNLSLWSVGETLSCTMVQDDIRTILKTANRINLKPDTIGNNQQSAKRILSQSFSFKGLINTMDDVDMYRFDYAKFGRFTIDATPHSPGPNVDLKLILYRGQDIIAEYNVPDKLNAAIDTFLNVGIYYLAVGNIGNANIDTYGMLGTYNITGTFDGNVALTLTEKEQEEIRINKEKNISLHSILDRHLHFVHLQNPTMYQNIGIYNMSGALIKMINRPQNINTIDLSAYASGIYIINVSGYKTFKVIKL